MSRSAIDVRSPHTDATPEDPHTPAGRPSAAGCGNAGTTGAGQGGSGTGCRSRGVDQPWRVLIRSGAGS